jgi:hypothetical protein
LRQRSPQTATLEATGLTRSPGKGRTSLRYIPGFVYVLALYIAGAFLFPDHRAAVAQWRAYSISWAEALLVFAAVAALLEQLRVSHPGVDNTIEAIMMGAIAGVLVLLFALAAAGVPRLGIFNTGEFLLLTLIGLTQAVVAILINARSLRRSIDIGNSP